MTAQRKALDETNEDFCKAPLSQVIRMAVEDLSAVEANERYMVDMGMWHEPRRAVLEHLTPYCFQNSSRKDLEESNADCVVCFAGSVLANRLGADINKSFRSSFIANPERIALGRRLAALNNIRDGNVAGAVMNMKIGFSGDRSPDGEAVEAHRIALKGLKVPAYSKESSPRFKAAVLKVADRLEKIGL